MVSRAGDEGVGEDLQRGWFAEERLGIAARGVGSMWRLLEETVEWATGREQGGNRIFDYQGVSFPLADSAADAAAGRLLMEAYTDFGGKAMMASTDTDQDVAQEVSLVVSGVRDFNHFNQIMTRLQAGVKDGSSIQERKIMRGKVVFGLRSRKTAEEVKRSLASAPGKSGFAVTSEDEHTMNLEVR